MADLSTTKMSSKGQVVIPDAIRKRLGLEPGDQFVVMAGQGGSHKNVCVIRDNSNEPLLLCG